MVDGQFEQKPDLKEDDEEEDAQDDGGDEDAVRFSSRTRLINFLDPNHDQKEEEEEQTRVGLERLYR